ncbi:MAG: hypothetical protein LAT76_12820, partial [Schleiferiaceae bacterium]|nr:hypothetical protein [Schleiferiaceae bacterium]
MKASLKHDYTAEDGQQLGATQHVLDPYTVYVSGNYVVKFYDEYADVSKHYYAGGQRIASKLWQWQYNPNTDAAPGEDPIIPIHPPAVQNNIVLEDLMDVLNLWDGDLGGVVPTLQELQNMQLPTRAPYEQTDCSHYYDPEVDNIYPQDGMTTQEHINCLCRGGFSGAVAQ